MKNYKFYDNKIVRGLTKTVLLTTLIGTIVIFNGCSKNIDKPSKEDVIQIIYQENQEESDILGYISVLKDLNKLNIDKYKTNDVIEGKPLSVEELRDKIKKYDKENEPDGIFLYIQKRLIEKYLAYEGSIISHDNITKATKEYIAEMYDIKNLESILISYRFEKADGEYHVHFTYNDTEFEYNRSNGISIDDEYVTDGAILIEETYLNNYNINSLEEAIIKAKEIEYIVNNNNLYDESKAEQAKKAIKNKIKEIKK